MNRMTKKTRRQKGGALFFGLFKRSRKELPTDINHPNYLIDLMLYNGTDPAKADTETLAALQTYTGSFDPFKPTSHKDESLLYMAHKRDKINTVEYLLLRNCNPMTAKCYWDAINFIINTFSTKKSDILWDNINNLAVQANIKTLDRRMFKDNDLQVVEQHNGDNFIVINPVFKEYLATSNSPGLKLYTRTLIGGKRSRTRKQRVKNRRLRTVFRV